MIAPLVLPHVGRGMLHMIVPLTLSVKKFVTKIKCSQQDSDPVPQD